MSVAKIFTYYIIALVCYLPWQNLLTAILDQRITNEALLFWLTHWYEPLLALFVVLGLLGLYHRFAPLPRTIIVVLVFAVYLLGHVALNFPLALEGMRFGYLALWLILAVYFIGLSSKQLKTIITVLLISALLNACVALFEQFASPFYWENWGIVAQFSGFGYGNFALARSDVSILQSASLIGGPNQLAQYLLVAFVFLLFLRQTIWQKYKKVVLIILVLAILMTVSRSAILAGSLVLTLYFVLQGKQYRGGYLVIMAAVLVAIVIAWQGVGGQLSTFFQRPGSDGGRVQSLALSMEVLRDRIDQPTELLFGSGLRSAGPATIKYGNGIVSENWFLQIALELGLLGLALYLVFIIVLIKDLLSVRIGSITARAAIVALLALMVVGLFLHPFADNPAATLTLFVIIAFLLTLAAPTGTKVKLRL